jgi:hypothetical protein
MTKVAILSAWLIMTPLMWLAATQSFTAVKHVLDGANPGLVDATHGMDEAQTRVVLRYMASEINRRYFWGYGMAQIVLGGGLLVLLWRETPRDSLAIVVVCSMAVLVLILSLGVTPLLVSIGRGIDFVPRTPPPPVMPRFWALHGAFTGLDGLKFLAGLGLLIRYLLR